MMKEILLALHQKPIAYYPIYRDITGSTTAAILLSQLMYWWQKVGGREFYKTDAEILEETRLSAQELKTAKKALKNISFMRIKARGVPARTFYNIDVDILIQTIQKGDFNHFSLVKSTKLKSVNQPNKDVEINQTEKCKSTKQEGVIYTNSVGEINNTITENTQETTQKNTQENIFSEKVFSPENSMEIFFEAEGVDVKTLNKSVQGIHAAKKDNYLNTLGGDLMTITTLVERTKFTVEQVLKIAGSFAVDQINKEEFLYPAYKDFKGHFYNWLLKQNPMYVSQKYLANGANLNQKIQSPDPNSDYYKNAPTLGYARDKK